MITINEELKDVLISESEGDMVIIDGNSYQLTNGSIELRNLSSLYDVVVYKSIEENHIERPVIEEPIIQQEPEL